MPASDKIGVPKRDKERNPIKIFFISILFLKNEYKLILSKNKSP